MQVNKLKEYIEKYKAFLKKDREFRDSYKWESLQNFQQNWELAAPKLDEMYARALHNSQTQRLWKTDAWYPKEMMQKFAAMDPDFVRTIFQDLFDESQPIIGRISRFKYFCDDLLQQYKKQQKFSSENNHYHEDNKMIFLYLCFKYPEKYTLYNYDAFSRMMSLLGSRNIPSPFEVERFAKITTSIYKFLQKDEELMELHRKRLDPKSHYMDESQLLVSDFYWRYGRKGRR